MAKNVELLGTSGPLSKLDLYSIRAAWTARNAAPGQDWETLYRQFEGAQADLGHVLRALGAFNGPPLQD